MTRISRKRSSIACSSVAVSCGSVRTLHVSLDEAMKEDSDQDADLVRISGKNRSEFPEPTALALRNRTDRVRGRRGEPASSSFGAWRIRVRFWNGRAARDHRRPGSNALLAFGGFLRRGCDRAEGCHLTSRPCGVFGHSTGKWWSRRAGLKIRV
jgi:hypothetical protein